MVYWSRSPIPLQNSFGAILPKDLVTEEATRIIKNQLDALTTNRIAKGKRVELQAIDDLEGSALHPFPLGRRLWREERRGGILVLSFFCSLGHQFTHCLLESHILLLQLYLSMNKQKRSQQGTHLAFADQTVIAML